MQLKINCPKCDRIFRVQEKHFGKRVRCPDCDTKFTVPVIEQSDPAVSLEVKQSETSDLPPKVVEASGKRPQKTRASTIIAFVMLGITVLFPIAVVGMFVLGSMSAASEQRQERASSSDIMGGSIVANDNGTFSFKTDRQKKAERAGTTIGLLIGSICFPGVPYAMGMLILGATYLALRSAGK